MKLPIKKLLGSINQSDPGNLFNFHQNFFDFTKEANVDAIKSRRPRSQILRFFPIN